MEEITERSRGEGRCAASFEQGWLIDQSNGPNHSASINPGNQVVGEEEKTAFMLTQDRWFNEHSGSEEYWRLIT